MPRSSPGEDDNSDGEAPASRDTAALGLDQLARHVYQLDWSCTRAFAPMPSGNGIHIVKAGPAYLRGVTPDEYPAFRDRLAAQLLEVRDPDTGERVVSRVSTRDELFAHHPQSALDAAQKATFRGLRYYNYDPAYRVTAALDTKVEPVRYEDDTVLVQVQAEFHESAMNTVPSSCVSTSCGWRSTARSAGPPSPASPGFPPIPAM